MAVKDMTLVAELRTVGSAFGESFRTSGFYLSYLQAAASYLTFRLIMQLLAVLDSGWD